MTLTANSLLAMETQSREIRLASSTCTSSLNSSQGTPTSTGKSEADHSGREQLQNNANKGNYFVRVDYEDLLNFDEQLASTTKTLPTEYMPMVSSSRLKFKV
jgi:hypothetical protein